MSTAGKGAEKMHRGRFTRCRSWEGAGARPSTRPEGDLTP